MFNLVLCFAQHILELWADQKVRATAILCGTKNGVRKEDGFKRAILTLLYSWTSQSQRILLMKSEYLSKILLIINRISINNY